MYSKSAQFYDELYHFKDYRKASEGVISEIRSLAPAARTLLDVACGTGLHLQELSKTFAVEGLDINPDFVEAARKRVPDAPIHLGDMTEFYLGKTFDAVTILFSSQAYVKTKENLRKTVACLARHLADGGVVIMEPWFSAETFWTGTITVNVVDKKDLKIVWMYTSERVGDLAVLDIHYMVGRPGGIEQFREVHELGLFGVEDYRDAFEHAGLDFSHSEGGPFGRGVYRAWRGRRS
ncbi:class I SAM-dependent methyltransferase [Phenylobacterium immobile]|uniref:class I SAM-dependent methyltransferase n=1 Tax=Phenylobacterium immobile TaxID=21 RepID=UPI000A57B5FF|nr:class I SAM-dependent methyltransferase [Phenylobacterium immobile]